MRFVTVFALGYLAAGTPHAQPKGADPAKAEVHAPQYTGDGRLLPLTDYREWIYLTSGLDMSYTPRVAGLDGQSMFDNVFVNPEAYRVFLATGTWPDGTMLVLEVRGAESNTSINKAGHSQSKERVGMEAHVKDEAHGGWTFYDFDGNGPGKALARDADCYSCHRDHAAVDTTFVQFYPTLLPIAAARGTLSANYRKDAAKQAGSLQRRVNSP